jgi:2-polyprenyl-6-methoxyphenol hydroxylase-like FAD-dependent oxidoreductase
MRERDEHSRVRREPGEPPQGPDDGAPERAATVIVVGAGPAGAALSYILARCGIDTLLLERHADFDREFRGEGVQASGLRCLEQMGLADDVAALPQTRVERLTLGIAGRVVDMPSDRTIERLRVISQPALLRLLCARAAAFPSFRLRMGAGVRALLRDATGRVQGVRLEGGEPLRADYVIATDGRHSVVRKRLEIALESIEQPFDVVWTRASLSGPLVGPERSHVELLPRGGFAAIHPAPTGGQQIGVVIRKGGYADLRTHGQLEALSWLEGQTSEGFWSTLRAAREQLGKPVLLDVICGRASHWSAPGALLVGDAAHPMSPVGGQGINMALRDAVVAANHLVPALRETAGAAPAERAAQLDAAARAIEAERRPEIEAIQALQTKRAKTFDRRRGRGSLWLIRLALRLRPLVRLLTRQRAAFGDGLTEVALRV